MLILLADAGGYVDEAAEALGASSVYVSPEVGGAALAAAIEAEVGDASIGVAVLPENAGLEGSGLDILRELDRLTGGRYDTIIIAVGDNLSAGSDVLGQSGEALRIANEAEQSGSLEENLIETVQGIIAASDSPPVSEGGGSEGLVIGLAIGVAVILAAIGGSIAGIRARRRAAAADAPMPDAVRAQVQTLRSLSADYATAGAAGHPIAGQTSQDIQVIADNVTHLFERLGGKAARDQRRLAEIEYGDKLGKLTVALDRSYLLDILTHPHLWDDPDERVSEVRDAVVGVSEQLVENIKQVNAQRALHFQVSLDTLIGRRRELRDWDREFHRATDDDQAPPG